MAKVSINPNIHFIEIKNANHFSTLAPTNELIAKKFFKIREKRVAFLFLKTRLIEILCNNWAGLATAAYSFEAENFSRGRLWIELRVVDKTDFVDRKLQISIQKRLQQ